MNTLFFDTETTGKADFTAGHQSPYQPRIVQFAALLCDDQGAELGMFSTIIKPDGWRIPAEAAAIHGITTEKAEECGVPILCALSMFSMFAAVADTVVAHNIDFDALVCRSEYFRAGKSARFDERPNKFCTMKPTTALCKIPHVKRWPGSGPYKYPKLQEAYPILLGKQLEGAHDALADVRACAEIYFWLVKNGHA